MSTKPIRNGERWSKAEEAEILANIKTGLTIQAIADRKQRTPGGIRSRLTRIACSLVLSNVPLSEASTRTSIGVVHILAALERKMDCKAAQIQPPQPPKMEFTFQQTTSREELRGLPHKHKMACLQAIAEQPAQAIQGLATLGETSYLWEMDEAKLPNFLVLRGCGHLKLTLEEVMRALRARYPGCKVETVEEWVDQIGRGNLRGVQTRILKSGIKIDWS